MFYTDDSYAAMLLTMALSPDREEYARPYSIQEFRRLEASVRASALRRPGGLLETDISGLMIYLGLPEEEAYRAYTLLHRSVQLTYALEGFSRQGIDVVTCYDGEYPQRLAKKLGSAAPAFIYRCGNTGLLNRRMIAVMGISGVKTDAGVRRAIELLVRGAAEKGYAVVTGGELGVARVASGLAEQYGAPLVEVLGGGMLERIHQNGIAEMIAGGRACALSLEHPESIFTVPHATARNRVAFALSEAAFIFNTDGRRGESEALIQRTCEWIYAWEGCTANRTLIARGAIPVQSPEALDFEAMRRRWSESDAEQMNLFDLL